MHKPAYSLLKNLLITCKKVIIKSNNCHFSPVSSFKYRVNVTSHKVLKKESENINVI